MFVQTIMLNPTYKRGAMFWCHSSHFKRGRTLTHLFCKSIINESVIFVNRFQLIKKPLAELLWRLGSLTLTQAFAFSHSTKRQNVISQAFGLSAGWIALPGEGVVAAMTTEAIAKLEKANHAP